MRNIDRVMVQWLPGPQMGRGCDDDDNGVLITAGRQDPTGIRDTMGLSQFLRTPKRSQGFLLTVRQIFIIRHCSKDWGLF